MEPARPLPVSIADALSGVQFLGDRTPHTTAEEAADAFALIAPYREGGVFVGHWAGTSEWERHPVADEIVLVIEGRTTIFFLAEGGEHPAALGPGDLVVVPRGIWHRFDTPESVKLLSVTPQPTDHAAQRPS
jgi:quercetin dioxygenase-like cupin family protein